jgi:hypothetical protein
MYYEVTLTQTGDRRKFSSIDDVINYIFVNVNPLSNTYEDYMWMVKSTPFFSGFGPEMEIFPRQLVQMRGDTIVNVRVAERMLSSQYRDVAIVEKKYKKPKYTSVW